MTMHYFLIMYDQNSFHFIDAKNRIIHFKKSVGKVDSNVLIEKWATLMVYLPFGAHQMKPVPVDHSGIGRVNLHVQGKNQMELSNLQFSSIPPRFDKIGATVQLAKHILMKTLEAECLWAFKLAKEDWSFHRCDGNKLFHRMFTSDVTEKFSIAHTKVSYTVRHGLCKVRLEELVADIKSSHSCFTLLDETTTKQVKKQCDFLIIYGSANEDEVCTKYITSTFLLMHHQITLWKWFSIC